MDIARDRTPMANNKRWKTTRVCFVRFYRKKKYMKISSTTSSTRAHTTRTRARIKQRSNHYIRDRRTTVAFVISYSLVRGGVRRVTQCLCSKRCVANRNLATSFTANEPGTRLKEENWISFGSMRVISALGQCNGWLLCTQMHFIVLNMGCVCMRVCLYVCVFDAVKCVALK